MPIKFKIMDSTGLALTLAPLFLASSQWPCRLSSSSRHPLCRICPPHLKAIGVALTGTGSTPRLGKSRESIGTQPPHPRPLMHAALPINLVHTRDFVHLGSWPRRVSFEFTTQQLRKQVPSLHRHACMCHRAHYSVHWTRPAAQSAHVRDTFW
jgi:hypothetical protein